MRNQLPINPPKILLIDKPLGITSFDVIRRLRRHYGVKKIGHAGTLDPMASGLLLIGIGPGTKDLSSLVKLPKEYLATIRLGTKTSTADREGVVEASCEIGEEVIKKVPEEVERMVGTWELPVPAFSAIKVQGRRLYERARKGEKLDLPLRRMEVYRASLESAQPNENKQYDVVVRLFVSSGTYIRSLAEELGSRLGVPAMLQGLVRTQVGEFRLEDSFQCPEDGRSALE